MEKLNKREIIKSLNNNLSRDVVILELEESQKLLEIQKTVNSQELEGSKKLVGKSGINVVLIHIVVLFVSGDTGKNNLWERIRINKTICGDEKDEWWNYTPKDKRGVINR